MAESHFGEFSEHGLRQETRSKGRNVSLLREIQDAAIDGSVQLPSLLRKCKVLAARLGNEKFSQWVDAELNGYPSPESLPDYRVVFVISKGHFSGPSGSGLRNGDIPISCIDSKFRDLLTHCYLMDPSASLEALVDKGKGPTATEPWLPDLVAHVGRNIYEGMVCIQAWKVLPLTAVIAAIDAIRNRILSFVLEIEVEAPDAGEAPLNSRPLPPEKVTQIFNTIISGDVQNVATGSSEFTQSASLTVKQGDFESLSDYLRTHGIEDGDIQELRIAIEQDEKEGHAAEMGPKKMTWLSAMYNKAKSGAATIGSSAMTKILTEGINNYLGF